MDRIGFDKIYFQGKWKVEIVSVYNELEIELLKC